MSRTKIRLLTSAATIFEHTRLAVLFFGGIAKDCVPVSARLLASKSGDGSSPHGAVLPKKPGDEAVPAPFLKSACRQRRACSAFQVPRSYSLSNVIETTPGKWFDSSEMNTPGTDGAFLMRSNEATVTSRISPSHS